MAEEYGSRINSKTWGVCSTIWQHNMKTHHSSPTHLISLCQRLVNVPHGLVCGSTLNDSAAKIQIVVYKQLQTQHKHTAESKAASLACS
jgi:hypothetical protein